MFALSLCPSPYDPLAHKTPPLFTLGSCFRCTLLQQKPKEAGAERLCPLGRVYRLRGYIDRKRVSMCSLPLRAALVIADYTAFGSCMLCCRLAYKTLIPVSIIITPMHCYEYM